jgi:hypothetical protein
MPTELSTDTARVLEALRHGHLRALKDAGMYRPIDGFAFGMVRL